MVHHYCFFYKNATLQFGWIREVRKNRLVVVPEQGKEFHCSPKQTELIWEGKKIDNSKEAICHLSEKAVWSRREALRYDIPTMHELCESGRGYTIEELAADFAEIPGDGWSKVGLLLALKKDSLFFRQKKGEFHARTPEEIEKIEEQNEKKREKERLHIKEQEWADTLLENRCPHIAEEEKALWDRFLRRLVDFVVDLGFSKEKNYFCALFRCSLKDPAVAERLIINCLKASKIPISWGWVILKRSSVREAFEAGELEFSEKLLNGDVWETPFGCDTKDHREKSVFTVDNPETRDFDDAIGWEKTEVGEILRIYIADVASLIPPESLLFESASKRISSVYTVKRVFPMLPPALSENALSLVERQDRAVSTFEIAIGRDGERRLSLYRSVINVDGNLSYKEVDRLIEQKEGYWRRVWDVCRTLKQRRIDAGSLEIDRIEIKLDISDPECISISSVRENTPATEMVEELAIYANYLAAKYCRERGLPALYRNQLPYSVDKGLEDGAPLQMKDIRIQPAYIDLYPEGHSALGLECYMQVTSPIRRFSDLVNQAILLSASTGRKSGFSEESLQLWAKKIEEVQREYVRLEKTLLDHWKIKYLAQNRDKLYQAGFVRYLKNGKALLNILEVQLYAEARMDGLREGEEFPVRIESINPDYNRVALCRA